MKTLIQKTILLGIILCSFGNNLIAQCEIQEDCVWPGDANLDGISNNIDVLYIGLTYDELFFGIPRVDMGTDWDGKEANDWPLDLPSGINYKHSDYNGDGFIDIFDFQNMLNNYDSINQFYVPPTEEDLFGEDLFLVLSDTVLNPSDTIHVEVHLGDTNNIIEDIHGIAFSILLDTANIQNIINIQPHGGWLNGVDTTYGLQKWVPGVSDEIDFGITRYNQMNVSGFGEIASFDIVIIDNITGVIGDNYADTRDIETYLNASFKQVLGLSNDETDLMISYTAGDSILLTDEVNSIDIIPILEMEDITIFPNPADGHLEIEIEGTKPKAIRMYNGIGEKQFQRHFLNQSTTIHTNKFAAGIYFLILDYETHSFSKKIVIQH